MTAHADETGTAGSHAFPGWALAEWADHILEQPGVGVTIVDRNGSVLFYNKWAERLSQIVLLKDEVQELCTRFDTSGRESFEREMLPNGFEGG